MIDALNFLRTDSLDTWSVIIRLVLAVLCGGVIGIERERKRRPAGFRTHILICLGAAITTLTSQFILFELGLFTDLTRLGAQVIAGIGFIGAGTIIITKPTLISWSTLLPRRRGMRRSLWQSGLEYQCSQEPSFSALS